MIFTHKVTLLQFFANNGDYVKHCYDRASFPCCDLDKTFLARKIEVIFKGKLQCLEDGSTQEQRKTLTRVGL